MTALADATVEQVNALGAVTEMLVEVERTISSMQAVRDGFLAVGSRLAVDVARQAASRDEAELASRPSSRPRCACRTGRCSGG
ncbi:hypothetical protein GCM10010458_08210 [Microbacterium luteolum]|uniref:hypothetical protein n=1 Tax=Microbacterium luteolum TaxID=69367 RepID=UPI00249B1C31|nr:hypothetical protein [Microbacterium luteolum]